MVPASGLGTTLTWAMMLPTRKATPGPSRYSHLLSLDGNNPANARHLQNAIEVIQLNESIHLIVTLRRGGGRSCCDCVYCYA